MPRASAGTRGGLSIVNCKRPSQFRSRKSAARSPGPHSRFQSARREDPRARPRHASRLVGHQLLLLVAPLVSSSGEQRYYRPWLRGHAPAPPFSSHGTQPAVRSSPFPLPEICGCAPPHVAPPVVVLLGTTTSSPVVLLGAPLLWFSEDQDLDSCPAARSRSRSPAAAGAEAGPACRARAAPPCEAPFPAGRPTGHASSAAAARPTVHLLDAGRASAAPTKPAAIHATPGLKPHAQHCRSPWLRMRS
mmetsp:Transcript_19308/g.48309  ORF Transcript_19308/g.48309 Transcript_19308/m.48309 type:complete len:247 (-) Transcript_19308:766-1506(-)